MIKSKIFGEYKTSRYVFYVEVDSNEIAFPASTMMRLCGGASADILDYIETKIPKMETLYLDDPQEPSGGTSLYFERHLIELLARFNPNKLREIVGYDNANGKVGNYFLTLAGLFIFPPKEYSFM